jgi:hypothetical protein
MKSYLTMFAIILVFCFAGNSFAQSEPDDQQVTESKVNDVCKDKVYVGVQIVIRNFDNPVEAEKLAAAVMNFDLLPTAPYCIRHSAGESEKRLEIEVTSKSLGTERGYDDQNTQVKRAIGQTGLDLLINSLPSKYRRQVSQGAKTFAKNYLVDPRITWEAVQVEVKSTFYSGKHIQWQGLGSRVFVLQSKSFPGQPGQDVRIIGGGSMQELQPYNGAIEVPMSFSNFNERRAKQFMKLIVTMDAMLPKNIIAGGKELLARKQQPQ